MNKLLKLLAAAGFGLALLSSANANPINGEITISLENDPTPPTSTVVVDFGLQKIVFNPSSGSFNSEVDGATNDYLPYLGTDVAYYDFYYGASFSPGLIWKIDPGTYFTLTSINIEFENSSIGVVLTGSGIASMTNKDDTAGNWTFSSTASGTTFSFSSTTSVPDSGMTAILLGLGLLATVVAARRKVA